ncbi:hypothetical protein ACIBM4_14250 [Streptomyces sp. NPDC050256]|uniref:hypothetical protein n=1 Tax=Streptomyces sp. NPDC050256 TaxID=3365607 RepID=UPI00378A12B9
MSTPIPDDKREEVLGLARSGLSRNEVSRRTGVSTASVSRIAAAAGVTFDRATTAVAVEARVIDLKAARLNLAGGLLDDIAEARVRLHQVSEPREFFDLARSVAVLTNAHVRIAGLDNGDPEAEAAKSMLGDLFTALKTQATQYDSSDDDTPVAPVLEPSHDGGEHP